MRQHEPTPSSTTTTCDLHIVHLVDAPEAAPVLVRWFVEEWRPYYGPGGPGDAEADIAACRSRNALPICLVALDDDGALLGTVALRTDSVGSELGVGPWLAALLVARELRGQGIGTALVAALEDEARRLGYAAIYTSTDAAERLMRQRGWQAMGTTLSLRGPITVFRRQLLAAGD